MKIHQGYSYENPDFDDVNLGIFTEIIEIDVHVIVSEKKYYIGIKHTDNETLQYRIADFTDTAFMPFEGEIESNLYFVLRNDMRSMLGVMVLTPTRLKFKDSPVYLIDFLHMCHVRFCV